MYHLEKSVSVAYAERKYEIKAKAAKRWFKVCRQQGYEPEENMKCRIKSG